MFRKILILSSLFLISFNSYLAFAEGLENQSISTSQEFKITENLKNKIKIIIKKYKNNTSKRIFLVNNLPNEIAKYQI